ncbi:MAG: hypothetical protein J6K72_06990 [Clostridia bacterium]|nr:hypothetical protein [Clostridia bacterium]
MADLTKGAVYREAREKIAPVINNTESRKKKLLQNAAAIVSLAVIVFSIVLYAYNTGYCKAFNLPPAIMPIDMKRLLPLAIQVFGIIVYLLYYISSIKADRALKKNRFSFMRLFWGSYIVLYFLSANSFNIVIGQLWTFLLAFLIPLLTEATFYWARIPKKDRRIEDVAHQIVLEDAVESSIFYTYYFKYGIFLMALSLVFAPMLGSFCAKAQREYQTCVVHGVTYAVIVDYEDRVLVQPAIEQDGTLQITTDCYKYLEKKDLDLGYSKYEVVTIDTPSEVLSAPVQNNSWTKIKGVLSMPSITDWLMVIITVVYVIATIFICLANIKSAKASKEQLSEMKREHEEAIRLQIIPFLQIEETNDSEHTLSLDLPLAETDNSDCDMDNVVRIKNLGNGAATNITYEWTSMQNGISSNEVFPINAIKADGEYNIHMSFDCVENEIASTTGILILHFDDMRGYSYTQRFVFHFCKNRTYSGILEIASDAPKYTGIMENA